MTLALIMLAFSSCSRNAEDVAYHEVQNANSIKMYKKYVKDHPEGKYVMDATKKIEDLTFDKCETIYDYAAYLEEFPEGKFAGDEKVSAASEKLAEVNKVLSDDEINDMKATVAATPPIPVTSNERAVIETKFGKMIVNSSPP